MMNDHYCYISSPHILKQIKPIINFVHTCRSNAMQHIRILQDIRRKEQPVLRAYELHGHAGRGRRAVDEGRDASLLEVSCHVI